MQCTLKELLLSEDLFAGIEDRFPHITGSFRWEFIAKHLFREAVTYILIFQDEQDYQKFLREDASWEPMNTRHIANPRIRGKFNHPIICIMSAEII